MGKIYYNKISEQLEKSICNNELSEEKLTQIYDPLKVEIKKKKQPVLFIVIFLTVIWILLGIVPAIVESVDTGLLQIIIVGGLIFIGLLSVFAWYISAGKVTLKWNKLIKEYYPSERDKLKL